VTAAEPAPAQPRDIPVLAVDVYGAMRMLGLGRTTVLALADFGELPLVRFGRSVRFLVGDIEALAERRRAAAAGAGIYRILPGDQAKLADQVQAGPAGVAAAFADLCAVTAVPRHAQPRLDAPCQASPRPDCLDCRAQLRRALPGRALPTRALPRLPCAGPTASLDDAAR
jgi:excisionase family DNA binding protein